VLLSQVGARFPSNTMWPRPRSISVPSGIFIHLAVWPQQIWAKNWVGLCPFSGGAESPSHRKSPGPRPTSIPSGILMHPAVWPQQKNIIKQNWNQFLLVVKATTLKQQISNFYPQIQCTDASDHIYASHRPVVNVKASFCA